MSTNTSSYYAVIPAHVRYDKSIPPNAKLLYGEISALCQQENYSTLPNNYFAELYGVTPQTISLWISLLVQKGYVFREMIYKKDSKEIIERRLSVGHIYNAHKVGV